MTSKQGSQLAGGEGGSPRSGGTHIGSKFTNNKDEKDISTFTTGQPQLHRGQNKMLSDENDYKFVVRLVVPLFWKKFSDYKQIFI